MANVTIYLPDPVEAKARKAAKATRQSLSRWVADQVLRSVESNWSREFLDAAGAVPDFPDVNSLRTGYGSDSAREELD
jgi:hypothetical protein